jgi:NitT/TauT family transport system ATP-binding protein
MSAIVLDGVTKRFRIDRREMTAVERVSLTLDEGGFYALIGPSGCGKSTLLRLIADVLQPNEGAITIGGKPPTEARRRHEIGFVFQDATLLPWRSVLENVRLPQEIVGGRASHMPRPQDLIELVGLAGFERARPAQLSGGMQQRVSIARALALSPKVLLLDEPFGALDEITRQRMNLELLRIWQQTGTTAVLVTHTIAEAVFMADMVHVLAAELGRLAASVAIDLPRPRRLSLMREPAFDQLQNQVREALFGEDFAREGAVDHTGPARRIAAGS